MQTRAMFKCSLAATCQSSRFMESPNLPYSTCMQQGVTADYGKSEPPTARLAASRMPCAHLLGSGDAAFQAGQLLAQRGEVALCSLCLCTRIA